jgi:hypothetical protein
MANVKILFRGSLAEEDELSAIERHFGYAVTSRVNLCNGDLVIPRYSFLPFGEELENDCKVLGARLINTYAQHRYVADLSAWYPDLEDFTPKTYFTLQDAIDDDSFHGSYVLKGETNSRKNQWKTSCFASNLSGIMPVYHNLANDSLIGQQSIYVRQFEPFTTYDYAINDQPITKEFRVFVLNGQVIGKGFYWTNYPEVIEQYHPDPNDIPEAWLAEVIDRVKDRIPFFVVDVAERNDGVWRVVELNCGTMSGLSGVCADTLYSGLLRGLNG